MYLRAQTWHLPTPILKRYIKEEELLKQRLTPKTERNKFLKTKMQMSSNIFKYMLFGFELLYVACAENDGTLSGKNTYMPKRIGLWNSFFADSKWKTLIGEQTENDFHCEVGCIASNDKSDSLKYKALYSHACDPQDPSKVRSPNQVYVFLWKKLPTNKHTKNVKGKFYNWTKTYSHKSEIKMPYIITERKQENFVESMVDLPQLTYNRSHVESMIAWVVSNCDTLGKRENYVELLTEHIGVDIYGRCGALCPLNCHKALAESGRYKFYLAFENSACRDYITEKPLRALSIGLVPIVYGGLSGEDYTKALPPKSFIDVRNFKSPEKLAKYLLYLDRNDTAYLEYFKWKSEYTVRKSTGIDHICQICQALHHTTEENVDLDELWNPKTECDVNFLNTLMGEDKIKE